MYFADVSYIQDPRDQDGPNFLNTTNWLIFNPKMSLGLLHKMTGLYSHYYELGCLLSDIYSAIDINPRLFETVPLCIRLCMDTY